MTSQSDKPMAHAISVRQPWAWLILQGIKPIENRSRATSFRGPLYLHTGQNFDEDAFADWRWIAERGGPAQPPDRRTFERGGLIGVIDIIDCVRASDSRWFVGPVGYVIGRVRTIPIMPMPGQLGIFLCPRLVRPDIELAA